METGRLFFDPSSCNGNAFFLGNGESVFRGPRSMVNFEQNSKKIRPLFSSSEDLCDEEYYDELSPEKKRRLTPEQVHMLEKNFDSENKLEPERKTHLAKKLGLQSRQVAVWFQNRRARWKTKKLEEDYDHLKASYDSLVSDCYTLVKENEKLKFEVISLNEKLQAKELSTTPIPDQKSDSLPKDTSSVSVHLLKAEDGHPSSRSTAGSAVVDEDSPQVVDSEVSYFPDENYAGCTVQSEEKEDSHDGRNYFPDVFSAAKQQQLEVGEPLGWWMWS